MVQCNYELVPGCIRKIRLRNFMQYDSVECLPSPHLNLIIGPNGTGKSSLVNAISIGLGGKPVSLGRATKLSDFIKSGQREAYICLELFKENIGNEETRWIIERTISLEGHSSWALNGSQVPNKEIEALIASLGIQTDNLCQFLPQDKVHEFSRLDARDKLSKTIAAVGDKQLRDDHEELKELQRTLSDGEKQLNKREQESILNEKRRKLESMETQLKNFREIERLEKEIDLLEQKRLWALVEEQRNLVMSSKRKRDEALNDLKHEEAKTDPVNKEIKTLSNQVEKFRKEINNNSSKRRHQFLTAKKKSSDLDLILSKLRDVKDEESRLDAHEKDTQKEISSLENEIEKLEQQLEEEKENTAKLEPEIEEKHRKCMKLSKLTEDSKEKLKEIQDQKRGLENDHRRIQSEIDKLENKERAQLNALKSLPNGKDACEGFEWLTNNMDKFKGKVYKPLLLTMKVRDPNHSIYLENVIPIRDLVSFAADNPDDVNLLINELRTKRNLRVNVVQVEKDEDANLNRYQSRHKGESFRSMDFIGFVKDLFDCPDAIKGYFMKNFAIHDIPVFGPNAETKIDFLIHQAKVRVFFINDVRFAQTQSRYSSDISSQSNTVFTRKLFNCGTDQSMRKQFMDEISDLRQKFAFLEQERKEVLEKDKVLNSELETSRNELKTLKNQCERKVYLQTKLNNKRNQLRQGLTKTSKEKEKEDLKRKRKSLGNEVLKLQSALNQLVEDSVNTKLQEETTTYKIRLLDARKGSLEEKVEEILQEIEIKKDNFKKEQDMFEELEGVLNFKLRKARDRTGNIHGIASDRAPKSLQQAFAEAGLPEESAKCNALLETKRDQLTLIDPVNKAILHQYNELRESIGELEQDFVKDSNRIKNKANQMEIVRQRWICRLEDLVNRIAKRFSTFFEIMGFAGDVVLNSGQHEKDFINYGIDVMVKFRKEDPFEKLDSFKQSGGERSVSTAVYMMALQELTVVPFRCVDEINQGMDSTNERRVFDLLVQVSCHANSAQYFLLTPKLLQNLNYHKNMKVLNIFNGPLMTHHSTWNMDRFVYNAKNVRNYN